MQKTLFRFACALAGWLPGALWPSAVRAANPILPNIGVCDPQVRVFNGRVYLYATHDASPKNKGFRMNDWWVWSSDDLVNWKLGSILKPEQTYIGKPFSDCWATDAATRDGKYYWYFSAGRQDIGVVESTTPIGPWSDPLGKPLVPKGLTPTAQRDPGILMDENGANYLIFGTWDFYLARLGDDMISLAETPRKLVLDRLAGPYGEGKTDDKPFLFRRGGKYYLSWGCYYAMADDPYGPYSYKGSIITPETTAPMFRTPKLTYDRHGSFFEYKNQWYFICNDFSQPGTTDHFRNSILSVVHFRENGEIAPLRIAAQGVGSYNAARKVEAEDYFEAKSAQIHEQPSGGFEVRDLTSRSRLFYPKISGAPAKGILAVRLSNGGASSGKIEVRGGSKNGHLLGAAQIPRTGGWDKFTDVEIPLKNGAAAPRDLAFTFRGSKGELARLDYWQFEP